VVTLDDKEESMVTLSVFNPSGLTGASKFSHAPRLTELNGKTICELSNGLWEADRTFPYIRDLLRKKFPEINIVPYSALPVGSNEIDTEKIGQLVAEKGYQGVIGGNAA